jgi:hypothetical protein
VNLETVLGIVFGTAVIIVLRWAAHRFPTPEEKAARRRQDRLDRLRDEAEMRQLEKELGIEDGLEDEGHA